MLPMGQCLFFYDRFNDSSRRRCQRKSLPNFLTHAHLSLRYTNVPRFLHYGGPREKPITLADWSLFIATSRLRDTPATPPPQVRVSIKHLFGSELFRSIDDQCHPGVESKFSICPGGLQGLLWRLEPDLHFGGVSWIGHQRDSIRHGPGKDVLLRRDLGRFPGGGEPAIK